MSSINQNIKMASCCGQNKQINAPVERKIGRCKICIRLSIVGTLLSNVLLGIILSAHKFHFLFIAIVSIVAMSFTVLSILHLIYYIKDKKQKNPLVQHIIKYP